MSKKLLVVGSNSIHTINHINLVKKYFDDVLWLTNKRSDKIDSLEMDFRLIHFVSIYKIKKIIEEFSPTHIHIHQANSYALFTLIASKNSQALKILNAWGSDILLNYKNVILKKMIKFNLKSSDLLVADSNTVLNTAKRILPKIKTKRINFGIDFIECRKKKESFIYSNRLHKSLYNIDKIIVAFSKFVKNNSEWRLIIAGDGEETLKLKKLVKELNLEKSVKFLGFVDRETNFHYYCISKIYVSIPKSDSISLSLVEATVSNCIPFVSNIPANRELMDEKLAIFVDDNFEIDFSLYKKIDINSFIVKDRVNKMRKEFSKSHNYEKFTKIYERKF